MEMSSLIFGQYKCSECDITSDNVALTEIPGLDESIPLCDNCNGSIFHAQD